MQKDLSNKKKLFFLPPKGSLEPNGPKDPIVYYYHPVVGFMYCKRIEQALSLLAPPYESILEIGYGSGVLLPALASIGKDIYGVDISSDPEKVSANLNNIGVSAKLTRSDFCSYDCPKEKFDLIVAISVLEHVDDLGKMVQKAFSLLRPGGHFLVGMPRLGFLLPFAAHFIGFHTLKQSHINDYRQFLEIAKRSFIFTDFAKLPSWLPLNMSLYFNMLAAKPLKNKEQ